MPKMEFNTKFAQEDEVYLMFFGQIVRGTIDHIHVFFCPENDTHRIGEKSDWPQEGPYIDYVVTIDHPLAVPELKSQNFAEHHDVLFRNPKMLIANLQKKYLETYEKTL